MNPGDFDQRIVIQSFVPAESSVVAVVHTFEQRVTSGRVGDFHGFQGGGLGETR